MGGGRGPPLCSLPPAPVSSVLRALIPGLSQPVIPRWLSPSWWATGAPLSSPPSGFRSPTEADVFQLDAEHRGPGA